MRPRLLLLAAVLAFATGAAALPVQSRSDFSGRWTSAPEPATQPQGRGARGGGRGGRSGDMGSGWGDPITITQDANALVVEYVFFARGDLQPPLRYTYALDGSETTNTVTMGRGEQAEQSRTTWSRGALVITSTYTFVDPDTGQPVSGTLRRTMTLESPTTMIVEVTREGVLGGPPSTSRTVYRKVSGPEPGPVG